MSSKDLLSLEQSNDPKSVYEAAKAYFTGKGVKRDYHKAFSLFEKTIELDPEFVTAYRFLGISYEKGLGTKVDMEKALHYYSEGSRLDSPACNYYLARAYENGNGVPKNEAKALKLYEIAAEAGVSDAMMKMGIFSYLGMGMEANRHKCIEWLLRARDAGNENAGELANLVMNSNLGPEEMEFQFLKVLAENDNAKAQNRLGVFYMTGNGVEIDEVAAANWFRKASELGYEYAMKNYAICLRDGAGVEANKSTAVEWFEKAARLGNIQSKYFLTEIYLEDGVLSNEKRAITLLEEVIESGNHEYADSARVRLARYYDEKAHEYTKAFSLWEAAAGHNNPTALYYLGFYYHNGLGTPVDESRAMYCWKKAVENGSSEAKQALLDLLKQREEEEESKENLRRASIVQPSDPEMQSEQTEETASSEEVIVGDSDEVSDDSMDNSLDEMEEDADDETDEVQSDDFDSSDEEDDEIDDEDTDDFTEDEENEKVGFISKLKNSAAKKGKAGIFLIGLMGTAALVIVVAVVLLLTRMNGCNVPAESSVEESSIEESSIEESSEEESSIEESSIEESSEEESIEEESSEEEDPILGAYKGYYTTGQGRKGLTVTLYKEEDSDEMLALFEFYPYEDSSAWVGPNYSGSYRMTVENDGDTYNCYALEWIDNPADLEMIHLLGTIQDGVYSGVNNYGRNFELTKVSSDQEE